MYAPLPKPTSGSRLSYHHTMRLFTAPLLLAASFFPAFAQTPTPPSTAVPTDAPPTTTTYRDDVLHLTYTYPAAYVDASAMVTPAFQASMSGDPAQSAQAACLSLPLSRMNAGNNGMGMLILVHANAACLKKKFNAKSVIEATQDEARGLAASGAKVNFGQPIPYDVATHPAALLLGSFTLPTGQNMQAMIACVLDQPDIACWQFLATTTDRLRTMSAFPVTFDATPPTPLVPATILTKP